MNKKAAIYGLWFYLVSMMLSFVFPKIFYGNLIVLVIYLISCFMFLYFIYFWKRKLDKSK